MDVILAIFQFFAKNRTLRSPAPSNAYRTCRLLRLRGVIFTKMIFFASARREKYFQENIFGAPSNFILRIQEIRSWLKTLFNQWYFGCFRVRISTNPTFS